MNGLIIINKEKDMTSHDVVAIARKKLKTKRIGHLGTLDPNATGVLVLCVGDACKLVPFLENDSKEYLAEVILGIDTNTYDITGEIVSTTDMKVSEESIIEVLKEFIGPIQQYPPIYSAIKIKGKKLYQYARNNEEVDIKPRKVEIYQLDYQNDLHLENGYYRFHILVKVSKGTYIRSLCHDIGIKLGCLATMGDLKRIRSGKFFIENAISINELDEDTENLISLVDAIDYPKIDVKDLSLLRKIENGMAISTDLLPYQGDIIAFINADSTSHPSLLAIYEFNGKEYQAKRIWK